MNRRFTERQNATKLTRHLSELKSTQRCYKIRHSIVVLPNIEFTFDFNLLFKPKEPGPRKRYNRNFFSQLR